MAVSLSFNGHSPKSRPRTEACVIGREDEDTAGTGLDAGGGEGRSGGGAERLGADAI